MKLIELQTAIMNKGDSSDVAMFVARGGDVNEYLPGSGSTLLHLAVEFLAVINALISAGADLDARDDNGQGWTPLHHAIDIDIDSVGQATLWVQEEFIQKLSFATLATLVRLGADPAARDRYGRTGREQAAAYGEDVVKKYDAVISKRQ